MLIRWASSRFAGAQGTISPTGTVLLLHFDGANGQATTTDARGHAVAQSSTGLALSTVAAKFGGTSSTTVGGVNCWQSPDHADWHFGSGAFTVDAWINLTSAPGSDPYTVLGQWSGSSDNAWALMYWNGKLSFWYSTTGSDGIAVNGSAWTPALNTWHHVAVDRAEDGTLRLYVNGAVAATASVPAAFYDSSKVLEIGGSVTGSSGLVGYMDEARIVKGAATFAGPFTPPSSAYVIAA